MKTYIYGVLFSGMFLLTGCGDKVVVPMIDSVGEIATGVAPVIADSSVLKEREVMATLRNRDKQERMATDKPRFEMDFAMIEVAPGVSAYLPKSIKLRDTPKFAQKLPTAPSEHPVWKTMDHLGTALIDKGFMWWGIESIATSFWESAAKGYNYYFNDKVIADDSFNIPSLDISHSDNVRAEINLINDKHIDDHADKSIDNSITNPAEIDDVE